MPEAADLEVFYFGINMNENESNKTSQGNEQDCYYKLIRGEKLTHSEIRQLFIYSNIESYDVKIPLGLSTSQQLLFLILYYRRFRLIEDKLDAFKAKNESIMQAYTILSRIKYIKKIYDATNVTDYFSLDDLINRFLKDIEDNKEWEDWVKWFNSKDFKESFDEEIKETVGEVFKREQFKCQVAQTLQAEGREKTKKILERVFQVILQHKIQQGDMVYSLVETTKSKNPELLLKEVFEKVGKEINKESEIVNVEYYRGGKRRRKIKPLLDQISFDF